MPTRDESLQNLATALARLAHHGPVIEDYARQARDNPHEITATEAGKMRTALLAMPVSDLPEGEQAAHQLAVVALWQLSVIPPPL